jgi:ribosomal protein L13E
VARIRALLRTIKRETQEITMKIKTKVRAGRGGSCAPRPGLPVVAD